MAILKWVSSLFLSSKQGEDLWCHFQSCAYPGLTFANHLWQTTLIFPIWPRFESFLLRTVFFILLSTCRWLAGSLVPTWLKSANVLASSLSGQWAYSSIAYDKFCVYISSSRAYYRESIDADIKREKEKQKAVSLSFIHFIDATLIDATLMTMLTLIMTCTASHISLASICVSQVHQSTSKCTSYYRKNWRLKNQPQSSPLLSGPPRPQG